MDTRDRLRLDKTSRRGRLLSTELPFLLLLDSNSITTPLPSHRYPRKLQHLLEAPVLLLGHQPPPPTPPSTNSLLLGARRPHLSLHLLQVNRSFSPTLSEVRRRWEDHLRDRDTLQVLFRARMLQGWESLGPNRARRRDLSLPFTLRKTTTLLLFLLLTTTSTEVDPSILTEVLSTRTKAAGRLRVPTVLDFRQEEEERVRVPAVPSHLGTSTRLPQSTANLSSIPTILLIPTVPNQQEEEEEQAVSDPIPPNLSPPSPSPPPASPNEPSPPLTVSLSTTLPLDSTPLLPPRNPTSILPPSRVQPSSQRR